MEDDTVTADDITTYFGPLIEFSPGFFEEGGPGYEWRKSLGPPPEPACGDPDCPTHQLLLSTFYPEYASGPVRTAATGGLNRAQRRAAVRAGGRRYRRH